MKRMPPRPVHEPSGGEGWSRTLPPATPLGGGGGGMPPFNRRRGHVVCFPSRQPPALVGRVRRPLEPLIHGGRTTVRRPQREDAGFDLTELLCIGFVFLGCDFDRDELPLVAQAPPPVEQPAGSPRVRRARLTRTVATPLGVSFAIAVVVARAVDGNGHGNGVARHTEPTPAGGEAPPPPATSEKPSPPHQQQPGAAAVHGKAIPASPAASSSPLAPATAPTTPTPATSGSDGRSSCTPVILFLLTAIVVLY